MLLIPLPVSGFPDNTPRVDSRDRADAIQESWINFLDFIFVHFPRILPTIDFVGLYVVRVWPSVFHHSVARVLSSLTYYECCSRSTFLASESLLSSQ